MLIKTKSIKLLSEEKSNKVSTWRLGCVFIVKMAWPYSKLLINTNLLINIVSKVGEQ